MQQTQSVLSLDLGGKYTGFFSFTSKDVSKIDDFQSGTIIYDESFVLSQVGRRGKRHTKRNNLRNSLVKRLFLLILREHYGLKIDFLPDEILGLFNKRGYTYASFELNDEKREKLESDGLREILEEKFGQIQQDSIERFLTDVASNEESFKEFEISFKKIIQDKKESLKSNIENNLTNYSEFIVKYLVTTSYNDGLDNFAKKINKSLKDKSIENEYGKSKNEDLKKFIQGLIDVSDTQFLNDVKQIQAKYKDFIFEKNIRDGLDIVENIVENHKKEITNGNLPRAKYFDELNLEMQQNQKIQNFFKTHNFQIRDIQNLIGNLSNYQLKELRRYFNDKDMANGDIWKPEQLHKVTWRFVQSWHPKNNEDKKRQKENLKSLKDTNIIEFLTSINPLQTIPPYDDMNNRGAVKCQTLRLNEDYLNAHLPNWRDITQKLANTSQKECLADATIKGYSEDSTLLHRILDISKETDIYELRAKNPSQLLKKTLVSDANKFHNFAQDYYELIRTKVRTGIWTKDDDMLKKCNHNPPYKNNQIHNLVSGILGIKISIEQFAKFENELWKTDKINRLTLSGYCKSIEELRKSHGNLFKQIIENTEDKEVQKYQKDLNEWTNKIGEFFIIEEKYRGRFNNLFSMAQLHTIIDTKRSGFNSTCKWCSSENQYRASTNIEINPETGEVITNANAQRLPADTQRPFSGKIERYIDKLGYEIAKIKAVELQSIEDKKIDLKIILEQNAFEYEESIRSAKIKNANAKAKKSLEEASKKYTKSLDDKDARIKTFSAGVCPYCGESLGEDGEIDHILPRSHTLKVYGTVLNSEGNLLYVHQRCNQAKKETIYKLQNIKAPITQEEIEKIINPISKNSYKTFTALTPEQQQAFKYALFLDNSNEIYQKVAGWLITDQSSRVNGTQKYLAKKIQEKLKAMLPSKEFDFEFILANANDVHDLRIYKYKLSEKPKDAKQEAYSHTIDAVMSLVSVWDKISPTTLKLSKEDILIFANVKNWSALKNEILTKGKSANQKIEKMIQANDFSQKNMRQIFSKSIFKDESIGERYKPIAHYRDKFYIGYPRPIKGGYDIRYCREIAAKNDIRKIEDILKDNGLCILSKEDNHIKIYSINKQGINEMSNHFFNLNYESLNDEQKQRSEIVEFIINNCKYYVKKTPVINAPQFINKEAMKAFPFYDEWQKFYEAYKKELGFEPKTKKDNGKLIYDISEIDDLWTDFCKKYFGIKLKENRNKARKVFSIMALTSAPGTVFRIKRKTPKGHIFQATAIDNQQIGGDYANVLLKGNSNRLALAGQKPSSDLKKQLVIKESKDIRDIKLDPSKLFKEGFDCSNIEVILNKTNVTVKNFPIDNLMQYLQGSEKRYALLYKYGLKKKKSKDRARDKPKSVIAFTKNNNDFGVNKTKIDAILKMTTRGDQNISKIKVRDNLIDFTLPYKNTSKLLDD